MTPTQRAAGNRGGQMTDDKCPSQQREQPFLQECFLAPPPQAQPPLLEAPHGRALREREWGALGVPPLLLHTEMAFAAVSAELLGPSLAGSGPIAGALPSGVRIPEGGPWQPGAEPQNWGVSKEQGSRFQPGARVQ